MSSIAIAQGLPRRQTIDTQPHRRSRVRAPYALLPWVDVPLSAPAHQRHNKKSLPPYAWGLIAAAIATHAAIIWFAAHHVGEPAKPKPRELALEFVSPPKPPEPRIEPPKPPPPKPQVIKQAQVLPQIQQAPPEPSNVPAAVSSEPPVAVAPVVSALPPPAAEPVTAAFGRAGYLNNPAPSYPSMAARQGWQGTVVLRVHVLSTGKPDVVEVQKSSGHKALDDEAVRTVQSSWTYTPAKRGNTPVDGWTTTPIEFRLDG